MEVKREEENPFPLATLTEVQFGLATSREIATISFYGKTPVQHSSQLSNARLGLPVKSGKCEACGTDKLVECEGHFGHIRLPTPIYHPFHVEEVKHILSRICLNCFKVKNKKSKKSLEDILQDGDQRAIHDDYNNEGVTLSDAKSFHDKMSRRKDGHDVGFKGTVANVNVKEEPQVLSIPLSSVRGDDMAFKKCKGKVSKNMKSSKVIQGNCSSMFGLAKKQTKQRDLTQREASTPDKLLDYDQQCKKACPYCQVSCSENGRYPDVTVKVVNNPEGIKLLELKISAKKSVPPGFWSFLDRYGYNTCNDLARHLLAYEALKILEQIPEKTLRTLGRDPSVKQPGALILECLPVPPNCIRIPDQWGKTTIMASILPY